MFEVTPGIYNLNATIHIYTPPKKWYIEFGNNYSIYFVKAKDTYFSPFFNNLRAYKNQPNLFGLACYCLVTGKLPHRFYLNFLADLTNFETALTLQNIALHILCTKNPNTNTTLVSFGNHKMA